jgi:hypothetical protein
VGHLGPLGFGLNRLLGKAQLGQLAPPFDLQRLRGVFGASRTGIEPVTCGLEGRCSIQLSYRDIENLKGIRSRSNRHCQANMTLMMALPMPMSAAPEMSPAQIGSKPPTQMR